MIPAITYYPAVGFANARTYIFLAFSLEKTERRLEWDEKIQLVIMPLAEVQERLLNGKFEEANTVIGLHRLFGYLQRQGNSTEKLLKGDSLEALATGER